MNTLRWFILIRYIHWSPNPDGYRPQLQRTTDPREWFYKPSDSIQQRKSWRKFYLFHRRRSSCGYVFPLCHVYYTQLLLLLYKITITLKINMKSWRCCPWRCRRCCCCCNTIIFLVILIFLWNTYLNNGSVKMTENINHNLSARWMNLALTMPISIIFDLLGWICLYNTQYP